MAAAALLERKPKPTDADIDEHLKKILEQRARYEKTDDAAAKGDADKFLQLTHPAVFTLFGGKEPFEAATRLALKSLAGSNVIEKATFGVPAELHVAGQEEICFVPFVQVARAGDIRIRVESFFIAVRPVGKADWKFIDAAGLRKQPEVLRQLFPGLPEKVVTPPNKVEIVK